MPDGIRGLRVPQLLEKAMDAAALRQKIAASNLANIQTPDYLRRRVRFEELLARAEGPGGGHLGRTRAGHLSGPASETVPDPVVAVESAEPDLEREIVELQRAALHFQALAQFVTGRYRLLLDAIGPVR